MAELVTIYFAAPLIVAVLAIPLLGERITGSRWAGLALLAAGLWAYAMILIRQIGRSEPTSVQMLMSNLAFLMQYSEAKRQP